MLILIFEFLLFSFEKSPCSGWNSPRFSFLLHPRWPFQLCYSTLNFLPSFWLGSSAGQTEISALLRNNPHYILLPEFLPFQLRWLLKHECYISLLAYISITPLLFLNAHIRFWGLSSFSFCSKSGAISTRSSADDALETLLLSLASLISLLVSSGLNE